MPRRNLNPTHNKTAPPVDSLGNVRVYFVIDRGVSAGVKMIAAMHHLTMREMFQLIVKNAVAGDADIAKIVGIKPR